MSQIEDTTFYPRVDAVIKMANDQMGQAPGPRVAASLGFATARFNVWLLANRYGSPEEMSARKDAAVAQLTEHFRGMVSDNFDEFIANYGKYAKPGAMKR